MRDSVVVRWAKMMLSKFPDEWQPKREPYKPDEALDEVAKATEKMFGHLRRMEDQTREELQVGLEASTARALGCTAIIMQHVYLNEDGVPTMDDPHGLDLPQREALCGAIAELAATMKKEPS